MDLLSIDKQYVWHNSEKFPLNKGYAMLISIQNAENWRKFRSTPLTPLTMCSLLIRSDPGKCNEWRI